METLFCTTITKLLVGPGDLVELLLIIMSLV